MDVEFATEELRRLWTDRSYVMGCSPGVVKAFRKRIQGIRSAKDERDFYQMKSWKFEKLHNRPDQHSMRLNDQYRLILTIISVGVEKRVRVIGIEDYH